MYNIPRGDRYTHPLDIYRTRKSRIKKVLFVETEYLHICEIFAVAIDKDKFFCTYRFFCVLLQPYLRI